MSLIEKTEASAQVKKYMADQGMHAMFEELTLSIWSNRPADMHQFAADYLEADSLREGSAGYGVSTNEDPATAVEEAIAQAAIPSPTLAIITCTLVHDPFKVSMAFSAALPAASIHGLTSSGLLPDPTGPAPGVACLLIDAKKDAFVTAFAETGSDAVATLRQACTDRSVDQDQLPPDRLAQARAIIMASTEGLEEGTIQAVAEQFGSGVPVFGGSAAAPGVSGDFRVLTEIGAHAEGVSLVAITSQGGVRIGTSMIGPYTPTDKSATVTSAEGRKVLTIDDQPASEWAHGWLGDVVKDQYENGGLVVEHTIQKPIGVKQSDGQYVPSIMKALNTDKSVDFTTPIKTGDTITVMDPGNGPTTGFSTTLIEAYETAVADGKLSKPKAGLLFHAAGLQELSGDSYASALTSDAFKEKVAGLAVLGVSTSAQQAATGGLSGTAVPTDGSMADAGNTQRNLSIGMMLFE